MSKSQQSKQGLQQTSYETESTDPVCVVCFKSIVYYAIGECDHLCCYECSTRIRVLCRQNDCPICRRDLAKVIFSKTLLTYHQLDVKNRSGLYDKKYRICFSDAEVQTAFFDLLDNRCPRCDEKNFPKFDSLREHVRKKHELFYCDICTEHLKIFSSERRCYTRQDLALHRRRGDPDNVGHRGHPLCEYCDTRFLDKDELFRHLRRDHYFCHFCDADGSNYFYGNYASLREHFRTEHYLCEEGDCEQEQFTPVFRTEIDLRAHRASVHGKTMNRLANKQTRTLELEFTYAPRHRDTGASNGPSGSGPGGGPPSRSRNNRGVAGGGSGGAGGGIGRGGFDTQREFDIPEPTPVQVASKRIDATSEQDFPSLGGSGAINPLFRPNNVSIRQQVFGVAGLARTKENFPALGCEGGESSGATSLNDGFSSKITASSLLKPSQPQSSSGRSAAGATSASMMIHVSNRPSGSAVAASTGGSSGASKKHQTDFPALPSATKGAVKKGDLYADIEDRNGMVNLNAMSAKHRGLVDDYVSVSSVLSKVVTVASKEPKKTTVQNLVPSVNSTKAFPTLGENNKPSVKNLSWVTPAPAAAAAVASSSSVSNKKKPAPAPNFKEDTSFTNLNMLTGKKSGEKNGRQKDNGNANTDKKNNNESQKMQKARDKTKSHSGNNGEPSGTSAPFGSNINNNHIQEKRDWNSGNKENQNDSSSGTLITTGDQYPALSNQAIDVPLVAEPKRGPPGFENFNLKNVPAPPPGFNNVTLNSVARSINNLTFTNSTGESYNILKSYSYVSPANASSRNQNLITHFQKALKNPDALEQFRAISQMFRDGLYNPGPYFDHCRIALGDRFNEIFPELIALLPNIAKQQELYLEYCQNLSDRTKTAGGKNRQSGPQLDVCQVCKQVLVKDDLTEHYKTHYLENNFPKLGQNAEESHKVGSTSRRK